MSGGRWYDYLPEAVHVLDAGGCEHRVRWRHGKVILDDHDVDAELALVALGGDRCACLDVGALFEPPPPLAELVRPRTRLRVGTRDRDRLVESLSTEVRRRLVCASAIAATRRRGPDDDRVAIPTFLVKELTPALERSLRAAQRNLAAGARIGLQLKLVTDRNDVGVDGRVSRTGGRVEVSLQARWLADVWAHGFDVVEDHAVLAVRERTGVDAAWVAAVGWSRTRFELTEPRLDELLIVRDGTGPWRVAARR